MNATIDFANIKPHLGDRRWAFEELCFLLFASEFSGQGLAIRREGSGGDGGVEGYICDSSGKVSVGLQAKYFIGDQFRRDWWRQMTESVEQALKGNAALASLQKYIVCTPRTFTQSQQNQWEKHHAEWQLKAIALGYASPPSFEHWDYSRLEAALLKSVNRGFLLYWFGYKDLTVDSCIQHNQAVIEGLHERFMPELHTPTFTESSVHYFLRSESAWQEFIRSSRASLSDALGGKWPKQDYLPTVLTPQKLKFEAERTRLLSLLGDGCRWPSSVRELTASGNMLDSAAYDLQTAYQDHLRGTNAPEIADPKDIAKSIREKCRADLGEYHGVGGWAHMFQDWRMLPDAQFLLFLGGPGSGKTHTIAQIVVEYQEAGGRVLFLEGRAFTSLENPWHQLLQLIGFNGSRDDFLDCFSAMADTSSTQAGGQTPAGLICIDALNETAHREIWLNHLEGFAAAMRRYPRLKLIVSCRSDFADLVVPKSILNREATGWNDLEHYGFQESVFDATMLYFRAYRVRGVNMLSLIGEMQNPLFLKTFCETFEDAEVPSGIHSLPQLLRAFIARKAKNIQDRIGCSGSIVTDSLRTLADAMNDNRHSPLRESSARRILLEFHSETLEHKSLYRGLCSEGILIENRQVDELGDQIFVRFGYERIWDYLLTLRLLPVDIAPHNILIPHLSDNDWRMKNRGLLGLLASRLSIEAHKELHDVAGIKPCTDRFVDDAFLESIKWRDKASVSDRTCAIHQNLIEARRLGQLSILALAHLPQHPWNSIFLHEHLVHLPLAERDMTWTRNVNSDLQRHANTGVAVTLIKLAENAALYDVGQTQTVLVAIALAWLCSTTVVAYRHRAERALARLLTNRMSDAADLVTKFKDVNDSQVLEAVMFGAAGSAVNSEKCKSSLHALSQAVFNTVFKGAETRPHIIIRHYARIVLEEAATQCCLPAEVKPASFRPVYCSKWPEIITIEREEEIERMSQNGTEYQALSRVVNSSRTESMGNYGDWGRYVMDSALSGFQGRLRSEPRAKDYQDTAYLFPDREARRYILQRVIELGLNSVGPDNSTGSPNRDRPEVERLGKKYQWIALHEFLAYVSDHYHHCLSNEGIEQEPPIRDLRLPDLLDPIQANTNPSDYREERPFTKKGPTWWNPLPHPAPMRLEPTIRKQLLAAKATAEPKPMMILSDGGKSWTTLAGYWQWHEPRPCWINSEDYDTPWLQQSWWCTSYIVPIKQLSNFVNRMKPRCLGGDMVPKPPSSPKEREWLRAYPRSPQEYDSICASTYAQIDGAYFSAMTHDARDTNDRSHSGFIPSPQIGQLLDLKWTKNELDFATLKSGDVGAKCMRDKRNSVCVADSTLLQNALSNGGLTLVWRLYSWKHSFSSHEQKLPQREYWAVYVWDLKKGPTFRSGGTWLDFANPEPINWA
ncbi:hypothetical protein [Prosthecobacter fluviatilis]|uniref:Restriction endonuclease n=1 Tax=Prosthecobacter fluviatilis TaxID=445931 RepID=A0ABW0KXF2_9BACT